MVGEITISVAEHVNAGEQVMLVVLTGASGNFGGRGGVLDERGGCLDEGAISQLLSTELLSDNLPAGRNTGSL